MKNKTTLTREEIIRNALVAAEQDGQQRTVYYNNAAIGKVKTYIDYESGKRKAIFISE